MKLQQRLAQFMQAHNVSQNQVAKGIGKSAAAVNQWLQGKYEPQRVKRALYLAGGSLLGLLALFLIFGLPSFSFVSPNDVQYLQAGYPEDLMEALRKDRSHLMLVDIVRSAGFIAVAGVLLWRTMKGKIRQPLMLLALAALVLVDLWIVNKRYDGVHYVAKSHNSAPFQMTQADKQILQDITYLTLAIMDFSTDACQLFTGKIFNETCIIKGLEISLQLRKIM